MKPVDQLIIDDGRGDCLRACVCSVLEHDPNEVPNFSEHGFFDGLNRWLAERGLQFFWMSFPAREHLNDFYFGDPQPLLLVWGESPRPRNDGGKKQHIVVGKSDGYGFTMLHDPHPDRTGIVAIHGFGFIAGRSCPAEGGD